MGLEEEVKGSMNRMEKMEKERYFMGGEKGEKGEVEQMLSPSVL